MITCLVRASVFGTALPPPTSVCDTEPSKIEVPEDMIKSASTDGDGFAVIVLENSFETSVKSQSTSKVNPPSKPPSPPRSCLIPELYDSLLDDNGDPPCMTLVAVTLPPVSFM